MEAVLFIGLQGAGKSTFYKARYFTTHVRISLDLLRTRHREQRLLETCLETAMPFVVDNTNPGRVDRERYLRPARERGYRTIGYYFPARVEECQRRNLERPPAQQVPLRGLLGTAARLERPSLAEGFNELFCARIAAGIESDACRTAFQIEEWRDELR